MLDVVCKNCLYLDNIHDCRHRKLWITSHHLPTEFCNYSMNIMRIHALRRSWLVEYETKMPHQWFIHWYVPIYSSCTLWVIQPLNHLYENSNEETAIILIAFAARRLEPFHLFERHPNSISKLLFVWFVWWIIVTKLNITKWNGMVHNVNFPAIQNSTGWNSSENSCLNNSFTARK